MPMSTEGSMDMSNMGDPAVPAGLAYGWAGNPVHAHQFRPGVAEVLTKMMDRQCWWFRPAQRTLRCNRLFKNG
jgi:hypothetical protein